MAEDAKTHGIGRRLIEALVREASDYALDAVFAFTYVAEFFRKMGFQEVERGELPLKAWKDCVRCPKFQCCDEIAVMRVLAAGITVEIFNSTGQYEDSHLVQLPVLRQSRPSISLVKYPQMRGLSAFPQIIVAIRGEILRRDVLYS